MSVSYTDFAFPLAVPSGSDLAYDGMKLRDWFAGQVSPSIMTAIVTGVIKVDGVTLPQGVAITAYEIADAMLAERRKAAA